MNPKDIETLYNSYKNSIYTVRNLEKHLIKESYSYDKWSESLRHKSETIRQMYAENENLIHSVIDEFLKNPSDITKDLANMFSAQIDFFMSEGYRDYYLVVPVLKGLIPYYKENGPKCLLFDTYYFLATEIMEQHNFKEAEDYYNLAISMYKDTSTLPDIYRHFRFCCAHYFRLLAAINLDEINSDTVYKYANEAFEVWFEKKLFPYISENRLKSLEHILISLVVSAIDELIEKNQTISQGLASILINAFNSQRASSDSIFNIDIRLFVVYHKYKLYMGMIDESEYYNLLVEKYNNDFPSIVPNYTYGTSNFIALFDDETDDSEFSLDKLFLMNSSYCYVYYLIPELLKYNKNSLSADIYMSEISKYYSDMPIITGDCLIDLQIEKHIRKIFIYSSSDKAIISLLEDIFVRRQVMTAIHSLMVSRLSSTVTDQIIYKKPEILIGTFGISSENEVFNRREEILYFVSCASILHDLGKVICSDIINLHTRKLTTIEKGIFMLHPEHGGQIADTIPTIYKYKDIILGHHKSYDGNFGYPENVDFHTSEVKTIIDIITVCDCIDAATDTLGRNYAKPKEFVTVIDELKADAGTRYSSDLVDFITGDIELMVKIHDLTKNEREHTYFEIYHNFVESNVKFKKTDELNLRMMSSSDLYALSEMSGNPLDDIEHLFDLCERNSFILTDGHNHSFGYCFTRGRIDVLEIHEMFIFKEYRRQGYGTQFMSLIENLAQKHGYRQLTMPAREKGHFDKFCWILGFKDRNEKGWMQKRI